MQRISRIAPTFVLAAALAAAATPSLVTTITLGPQPPFVSAQQMAVNPATNRLYVLNATTSGTPVALGIAVVDTAAGAFTTTLHPPLPAGMNLVAYAETRNAVSGYAVNPATNRVYVAYSRTGDGLLVAIDSTTDTIAGTATIPSGITNVAVNPATNKVYVMQTPSTATTQILVLDGNTLAQTGSIPGVENGPLVVNSANNKIYAAVPGPSFGVAVIDGAQNAVLSVVPLPVNTYDLLVNPVTNNVYAKPNASQASPDFNIYKIDGVSNQLAATIASPFAPTLGFDASFAFVDQAANQIYSGLKIDGASDAVNVGLPAFEFTTSPVPLTCQSYTGLSVDFPQGNMYGGCDGDLIVANTSNGAITSLVPVSYVTSWVRTVVNPANHALYGLNNSSVALLDPVSLTARLVPLGNLAGGVAANPASNQVYVTDMSSSAAVVVDGATNAVSAKIFTQIGGMINAGFQPDGPLSIAVNKTKNQYIVAGQDSGMVLDGTGNAAVLPIRPQLTSPLGFQKMAVDETTNKLYSTNQTNVYVTDLATGSVQLLASPSLKLGDLCSVHGLTVNAALNWVYATANCSLATPILFVYDGTTGAAVQNLDLGAFMPLGSVIGDVMLNPNTNKLYVVNYGGSSTNTAAVIPPATEVFNAATLAHLTSIPDVIGPLVADTVLNAIYGLSTNIQSGGSNVAAVVDGNTDTLSSTFPLGFNMLETQPAPIAVNEATHMVYFVNQDLGVVSVFQGNLPSPGTFSISGQLSGSGAAGVTITAQGGVAVTTVTSASGAYTLAGLPPGAYTVTPTTGGLFYSPQSQSVNITTANVTGINFAALSSPIAVTGLSLSPWTTIGPGVTTNATVTLNQAAPAGGITLNLSASNTKPAKFPSTVTVPGGSASATFSVQGNSVGAVTSTVITAAYQGTLAAQPTSASATLTVSPTDSLKVQSATWSKSSQILQVSATSTNPQSILQLFLASNNQLLGTFVNQGNGSYTIQVLFNTGTPASVNVKSNLGGSTGQGVTVTP